MEIIVSSNLVPIVTFIAIIFGSNHKNYCNLKWAAPIPAESSVFHLLMNAAYSMLSVCYRLSYQLRLPKLLN